MIQIVTDSMADLPVETVAERGLNLIPSYITFGSETMRDRIELNPAEFFRRLTSTSDLPTTSQASVRDFEVVYRRLLDQNPQTDIISLHCSSALSGSIESGRQAARLMPGANIRVFDSRSISVGQGLMVIEAATMAQRGATLDEIIVRLEAMRAELHAYFTLQTLDYLAKGGRIGRAARLLGTLLDMKPLLKLENGVIGPDSRHRSRERAVEALKDRITAAMRGKRGIRLAVAHGACEAEARALATQLQDELKPDVFLFSETGPAIGTYTGPGVIGVFGWAELT